jgi:hypothetical protein
MSWVLRHSEARLGERLVLLVLADHAKDDGSSAWPSVATIAHEAHLSEKQVQRCLASLKLAKRIRNTGKSRSGTNVYSVSMVERRSKGDILSGATNPTKPRDRMSPEPSLVQPSEDLVAATPRPKPRNVIWDALTYVFGEPTSPTAISKRGKVCRDLKAANATPDQVVARASAWPAHFDDATLTPEALEKHWDTLGRRPLRRR